MNKSTAYIILFLLAAIFQVYSQTQIRKIVDLSVSPVSAFKKYCARCHGYEGSSYGKGFADLKEDSLRIVVEDMMFGPGGLKPDSIEVDAMTEYNKTFKNKTPFAAALNSKSFLDGKYNYLEIESSPDSKLEIKNEGIKVEESKNIWRLYYDPQKIKSMEVVIKKNNFQSTLNFPGELYTH